MPHPGPSPRWERGARGEVVSKGAFFVCPAFSMCATEHRRLTPNPLRRLLPLGNPGGVLATLHPFLKSARASFSASASCSRSAALRASTLAATIMPLWPIGEPIGGDVLPAVARAAGREAGRRQPARRHVPADVAHVGRAAVLRTASSGSSSIASWSGFSSFRPNSARSGSCSCRASLRSASSNLRRADLLEVPVRSPSTAAGSG